MVRFFVMLSLACIIEPSSDLVPLIIQVINVDTGSTLSSWSSLVYMIATFILYIIQLGLTAFALTILHFKSKQFKNTSNKKVVQLDTTVL